jgi:hypothetical protein
LLRRSRVTPGILPFAVTPTILVYVLRASLRLFKFVGAVLRTYKIDPVNFVGQLYRTNILQYKNTASHRGAKLTFVCLKGKGVFIR